ncbi:DUF2628 domain-containing protein [Caballeronia sp. M1242]|uniref:DUF2628 domain-containing protein n=1 Tax=Caballeronia sp. M1242 TaxID=2814653 RepID=UPI0019D08E56|nr:DUF2628 domain-containing protein [Caballeronia sp. M1242]QSN63742.1 DUF2628 domain-containing protein [Caballeronia sp. M1242]
MNQINEQAAPQTDAHSASFQLDRDMALFVGKNIEYYSRKWVIQNTRMSKRTWNGAAFLLGPVWLVYRKMRLASRRLHCNRSGLYRSDVFAE